MPLKREPGGGDASLTIRSSSIESFERVSPRGRRAVPGGGFGSVACSIPLGLMFGRGGPPLSRAISSRSAATTLCSSVSCSHCFTTKLLSSATDRRSRSMGDESMGGDMPTLNPTRAVLGIL